MALSTNQFKNGNHIEVDGTIFKIVDFQHVKPGKGGAFVRTKLRRAADGNVIDRTFRAGEKFRSVRTESRKMQFLYADGTDAHFMDTESFEQIAVPEPTLADALRWCTPSSEVDVLFIDDQPARCAAAKRGRPGGHADRPGAARGLGLRRRHEAGDAGDRRGDPGAAVRRAGPAHPRGHALGRIRGARLSDAPLRAARAAVVALYQHDLTGRPLARDALAQRDSLFVRALAHAAADRAPELDEVIDRHCPRLVGRPHPAAGAQHHARGADRDAASRCGPRRSSRSRPEGAIEEAVESAKMFCGAEAPGFVNGVLAAVLREVRENARIR